MANGYAVLFFAVLSLTAINAKKQVAKMAAIC